MKKSATSLVFVGMLFAGASAVADHRPDNTHPGANPAGQGHGCSHNPGKSDCYKHGIPPTPPSQPSAPPPSPAPPPPSNSGGGVGIGGSGVGTDTGVGTGTGTGVGTGTGIGTGTATGGSSTATGGNAHGGGGGSATGGNAHGGTGGTGTGTATATTGPIDVNNAAQNWSSMTQTEQNEVYAKLTAAQKQQLTAQIDSQLQNYNYSPSQAHSSSSLTGNTTTTTVGGSKTSSSSTGGANDARATTGPTNAGGANVSTHNESNVLQVNLPTAPSVAPTVVAQNGAIAVTGTCGPRKEVETIPIEYLLVGHIGTDKVQLSGQTTDRLIPAKDGKQYTIQDNGDGSKSLIGTLATTAIMTVSGSTSKQFGFGLVGGNGAGSVSNGASGTLSITQRFIAIGDCEVRRWREVGVGQALKLAAAIPAPASDVLTVREEVTVRPTGPTWRVGEACKMAGANCKRVEGAEGKRRSVERTFDCARPTSAADAKLCAERTSKVGQPPVMKEDILK